MYIKFTQAVGCENGTIIQLCNLIVVGIPKGCTPDVNGGYLAMEDGVHSRPFLLSQTYKKAFKILQDLVSIHTMPQVDHGFVLTTPL